MALPDFGQFTSLRKFWQFDSLQKSYTLHDWQNNRGNEQSTTPENVENSDTCGETWQEEVGLPCATVVFLLVHIMQTYLCMYVYV